MPNEAVITAILVVACLALVWSGIKGVPGLGILLALGATAATVAWVPPKGLSSIGFYTPESWVGTILVGVAAGVLLQFLSVVFIEPMSERVTGGAHDHSIVEGVRDSVASLVKWLLLVWLAVALLEETIYRGYLITEIRAAGGSSWFVALLAIAGSATVFGLSHWYQGRAGALSTGLVGGLLGVLFVAQDYNLWAPIVAHGVIDTVGIVLIARGWDRSLRRAAGWDAPVAGERQADAPE